MNARAHVVLILYSFSFNRSDFGSKCIRFTRQFGIFESAISCLSSNKTKHKITRGIQRYVEWLLTFQLLSIQKKIKYLIVVQLNPAYIRENWRNDSRSLSSKQTRNHTFSASSALIFDTRSNATVNQESICTFALNPNLNIPHEQFHVTVCQFETEQQSSEKQ